MSDDTMPSTSIGTIRNVPLHISIPISDISDRSFTDTHLSTSEPPSPHSSLPSSPSGDSVSSFPSVSSSFLFSSVPATPPQIDEHHHLHAQQDDSHELIIPSLTLPSALRRPTLYGKILGDVKILVLSRADSGSESTLSVMSDEDCEDFVEVGQWEELDLDFEENTCGSNAKGKAKVLRASTDWIEHRDAHGLEKYEPTRNVEIVHLPEYDIDHDPADIIRSVLSVIHSSFHSVLPVLNTDHPPSPLLVSLLSSPTTPLYTVLLYLFPSPPSQHEQIIISELSTHIPLITLPPLLPLSSSSPPDYPHHRDSSSSPRPKTSNLSTPSPTARSGAPTSALRPQTAHILRTSLLRSPETLSTLRLEAVDRFLRWREVERGVERVMGTNPLSEGAFLQTQTPKVGRALWHGEGSDNDGNSFKGTDKGKAKVGSSSVKWDKAKWEAEWEGTLSADVARTLKQRKSDYEKQSRQTVRALERRMTVTSKSRPSISPTILSPRRTQPLSQGTSNEPHLRRRRSVSGRGQGQSQGRRSPTNSTHSARYARTAEVKPDSMPIAPSIPLDPLHFPSLVAFSLSLFAPLRARVFRSFSYSPSALSEHREAPNGGWGLGFSLVFGAFCAGLGIGILVARASV